VEKRRVHADLRRALEIGRAQGVERDRQATGRRPRSVRPEYSSKFAIGLVLRLRKRTLGVFRFAQELIGTASIGIVSVQIGAPRVMRGIDDPRSICARVGVKMELRETDKHYQSRHQDEGPSRDDGPAAKPIGTGRLGQSIRVLCHDFFLAIPRRIFKLSSQRIRARAR
jgi:hypothetical protein